MPTAIILSAAAMGQAAAAQAEADRAKRIACDAMMPTYKHDGATLEQARQYAECVNFMYPQEMPPGGIAAVKFAIVVILLAMAFGAVKGWKDDHEVLSAVMFGVMAALISLVAMFGIALLALAVEFLVS